MPAVRELILDEAQRRAAAAMREWLLERIEAAGGWLSFEAFMDGALYAPGLGYYSGGARKLGAGGDFTTAPELSQLFGACLARQCAEVLKQLPEPGVILEIGAGSGRLAGDLLLRLESLGCLPGKYWILEISADLRERQRALLLERCPHLLDRCEWLDAPPPRPFCGVLLANEVLDALPVRRFRWQRDRIEELGVSRLGSQFKWAARSADAALAAECERLKGASPWEDGYVSEYCPRLPAWTRSVAQNLRCGAALWFDYGLPRSHYYLDERRSGTLLCHIQQRAHDDPFLYPGLQDITAWVDFTRLAEASREAGFELSGFATQGYFLAALRIDEEMARLAEVGSAPFARLANEARQLMLPGEMGERFKAMAWTRGIEEALSGFALQDLRHTL